MLGIKIMQFRMDELVATLAGYAKTGVPLISQSGEGLRAAGFTDDPGLYFFVPAIARILRLDASTAYAVFIVGVIVAAAAVGLAGLFALTRVVRARAYAVAVTAVLALGALMIADVYVVGFAYPMAFLPWVLAHARREQPARAATILLMASAGALGACAHLIRSHAATSMLLFLAILAGGLSKRSLQERIVWLLAFVLGAGIVLGGFSLMLDQRDAYLARHVTDYQPTPVGHPFWHSAYLGLAYLDNEHVSAWDDRVAARRVEAISPGTPYCSEEYERILRSEYWRIVSGDPLFALRTYGAKLLVAIVRALACFGLGSVAIIKRRPPGLLVLAFLAAIAFEALPALMTMPFHPYMLGLYTWSGLFGAISVVGAVDPQAFGAFERKTHRVASA